MQSVVENVSGLSRKMKITIPQEHVSVEVDKRIKDLAKKVAIRGFRKGKVPASVVKLHYGASIRQEVIQDQLWESLQQALKDQNIRPVAMPDITVINIEEGAAPLEFEASFEVYPEITVSLEGITIEKPSVTVEDKHVQDVIEKLRNQNVKWNEEDKAAEQGDMVVIDFEGYIDDALFEGGSAKDFRLELGKGNMIPGFEESIYGKKAGDTVEAKVTFPDDYHAQQYAGKAAKFVINIHKVMVGELPVLDDAFAKDLGVSIGTIAGLNKEVRENLESELARRIHDRVKAQLLEKVLAKNEIEVPQASVEEEITRLQKAFAQQISMQTGKKEVPDFPREHFEEQARKNVILGLLLSKWIKDNDIKVDPSRVRDRVDQIASGFHQPHDIVNWYYGNKEALSEIEGAVLEEQAIEKILENIEVVEKGMSFDDIMKTDVQRGDK